MKYLVHRRKAAAALGAVAPGQRGPFGIRPLEYGPLTDADADRDAPALDDVGLEGWGRLPGRHELV